jgi:hypothetical protein
MLTYAHIKHNRYELVQQLDAQSFHSLPDSSSSEQQQQRFCAAGGVSGKPDECVPGNMRSGIVPGLRGTTATHFFEAGGERYLAVAQSVCSLFSSDNARYGAQFACVTSTNVQILTPEELLARACEEIEMPQPQVLSLRAVLVRKYRY